MMLYKVINKTKCLLHLLNMRMVYMRTFSGCVSSINVLVKIFESCNEANKTLYVDVFV